MKKGLFILAIAGCMAVLSTSCVKSCNCKEINSAGTTVSEYNAPKVNGSGWKCKDFNETYADGSKLECK